MSLLTRLRAAISGPRTRRVLAAGFVMSLGNIGTIALQLVSVPVLLAVWGAPLYGEWLIVSTVLGYLGLSDLGLVTVAHNRIDAQRAQGDDAGAARTFVTSLTLLAGAIVAICGGLLVAALLLAPALLPLFTLMSPVQIRWTFLALIADGAVMIIFSHCAHLLRSIQRFAETQARLAGARLVGVAAIPLAAAAGAPPLTVALVVLVIHIAALLALLDRLRTAITWFDFRTTRFDGREARSLLGLTSAFLLLPASVILYLQGSILIVAAFFGPTTVAMYSTLRTFTRLIPQFVPMTGLAFWSEIAQSSGGGDHAAVARMARFVLIAAPMLTAILVVAYLIAGPWFFGLWTHHQFSLDMGLFVWLLAHAALLALSTTYETFILSTNRHQIYALVFFSSTAVSLALSYVLAPAVGLAAIPLAAAVLSILPVIYCLWWISARVLRQPF